MPLPRARHVFSTTHPVLHRAPSFGRRQRSHTSERSGLRLFSAKRTAHSANLHGHLIKGDVQNARDQVLNFRGVLA